MAFPSLSVCREFSAENLNAVVSHPDVRPWVGGSGPIDLSSSVADQRNVLLMGEGGGLMFIQLEPGIYEAHTQFLPEARGKAAIQATQDALRWMFTRTDANEIVTKVPDGNAGALGLVRAIHGEQRFYRPDCFVGPEKVVGVKHFALPIAAWAGKCAELALSGQQFHDKLEAAKAATVGAAPLHEDDEAHDRYVGATVEMILAGQVAKAIDFYNRWARFAGYGPVAVIATNPIVLDIGDALIAVRDQDFDILLCR